MDNINGMITGQIFGSKLDTKGLEQGLSIAAASTHAPHAYCPDSRRVN